MRVSKKDGKFYYDLCDKVIEITPYGWKIIDELPILFRRYSHMKEQVIPVKNGDIWQFFDFVKVAENHRLLIIVYIISCFVPEIPKPIFYPKGAQGSGKTTLAEIIKSLCDPSETPTLIAPRKDDQLVQNLAHHYMSVYDNLSDIPVWMSDILCQMVTGGGYAKRQLYTDDGDFIYKLKGAVGINGINLCLKPDLLDRTILLHLEKISQNERRNIREVKEGFEKVKPEIMGGIFDVLSKAMNLYPFLKGKLETLPRMADFAEWGYCIAESIKEGYGEKFIEAYQENVRRQHNEIIENSTLAQSVIALMNNHEEWEGTIKDCYTELCVLTGYEMGKIPREDTSFPKSINKLRGMLKAIKSDLSEYGIDYKISNHTREGTFIYFQKSNHDDAELE